MGQSGLDGLGLSPRRLTAGLRWSELAFGAVAAVALLRLALPASRAPVRSPRTDITSTSFLNRNAYRLGGKARLGLPRAASPPDDPVADRA